MVDVRYAYERLPFGETFSRPMRRVLTAARWPRGLSRAQVDHWFPELAPDPQIRIAHLAGRLSVTEYLRLYAESLAVDRRQASLVMLQVLARQQDLVLLSLRKDVEASHLQVVRRFLTRRSDENVLPA